MMVRQGENYTDKHYDLYTTTIDLYFSKKYPVAKS